MLGNSSSSRKRCKRCRADKASSSITSSLIMMGPNPKPTVPHETSTFESTCLVDTGDPVQYYLSLSLSLTHPSLYVLECIHPTQEGESKHVFLFFLGCGRWVLSVCKHHHLFPLTLMSIHVLGPSFH